MKVDYCAFAMCNVMCRMLSILVDDGLACFLMCAIYSSSTSCQCFLCNLRRPVLSAFYSNCFDK